MPVAITQPYRTDDGRDLVLRVDRHHGFWSHWIETPSGKRLTPHYLYDPCAVADILNLANADTSTSPEKDI